MDGHGGARVAKFIKEHFKESFIGNDAFKAKDYKRAFKNAFLEVDAHAGRQWYSKHTGSTVCMVLVTPT